MQVNPQIDGSLKVDRPDGKTRFDMGNRSLFIQTNGRGDLDKIFFAWGAHAGGWRLNLSIGGKPVVFSTARAAGRMWKLAGETGGCSVSVRVYLDEKSPLVFERIEVNNPSNSRMELEVSVQLDITAPPPPKTKIQAVAAKWIPRLPAFCTLWSKGWARRLQEPSPSRLTRMDMQTIRAEGKPAWYWISSLPLTRMEIRGKKAEGFSSIEIPSGETKSLDFVLGEEGFISPIRALDSADAALVDSQNYAAWLEKQVDISDPTLKSLYISGLNASVSMYKEFPGGFKGLVAGPDYAFPPRIYFRDGYWTAQALIDTRPELVREHLICLSTGVHADGQCPSGIFAVHLLKEWHAPANCNADWLSDHFDSPAFYILLLNDYLTATGDWDILNVVPPHFFPGTDSTAPIWQRAFAAMNYLIRQDHDGDGMIEKPYQANDWADNIRRNVWVAYDQALYVAALRAMVKIAVHTPHPEDTAQFPSLADSAWKAMVEKLWDEKLGYFVNYRRPDFTEDNLSLDMLNVIYQGLADEKQTRSILDAAERMLQTGRNREQPYGNFGMLCAYPLYRRQEDLFDKSALPYCYHNGSDWPYLDGMYAAVLLRRADPQALEVLTRWWKYSLEQGWLTPVEYYSPAWPVGGMLQGWSSMPAAAMRRSLDVVRKLAEEKEAQNPHR
jgi:hypothetical protein